MKPNRTRYTHVCDINKINLILIFFDIMRIDVDDDIGFVLNS